MGNGGNERDLPGLLEDSKEDGGEDVRELRGVARHGRDVDWGPKCVDAGQANVMDEGDTAAEVDDEGKNVADAALAALFADEDMAMEDDIESALEGKCFSRPLCRSSSLTRIILGIGLMGLPYVVPQNVGL